MSPTAWPFRPKPATRTSSFSCRNIGEDSLWPTVSFLRYDAQQHPENALDANARGSEQVGICSAGELNRAPFTSMKLRQPSFGTKAVIFLPFLMSWTLTHFLMAELGCLASTPLEKWEIISSVRTFRERKPPESLAAKELHDLMFGNCNGSLQIMNGFGEKQTARIF